MAERKLTEAQAQAQYDYFHDDEFREARRETAKSKYGKPDYSFVNELEDLNVLDMDKSEGMRGIEKIFRGSLVNAKKDLEGFLASDLKFFNLGELQETKWNYQRALNETFRLGKQYTDKEFFESQKGTVLAILSSNLKCQNPTYCQTVQIYRGIIIKINEAIEAKLVI